MSEWHAWIEDDDEGNICICLQDGDNASTKEIFETVEHDVKDSMPDQENIYLEAAEEEADRRNGDDLDDEDEDEDEDED